MYKNKIYVYLVVVMSVAQSCLTLWDPMDCSPPGSSVYGILPSPGDLPKPGM